MPHLFTNGFGRPIAATINTLDRNTEIFCEPIKPNPKGKKNGDKFCSIYPFSGT